MSALPCVRGEEGRDSTGGVGCCTGRRWVSTHLSSWWWWWTGAGNGHAACGRCSAYRVNKATNEGGWAAGGYVSGAMEGAAGLALR